MIVEIIIVVERLAVFRRIENRQSNHRFLLGAEHRALIPRRKSLILRFTGATQSAPPPGNAGGGEIAFWTLN